MTLTRRLAATLLVLVTAPGCGGGGGITATPDVSAERCIVRLHGKGGAGAATVLDGAVAIIRPDSNGTGWGGRQWEYETAAQLDTARALIGAAVDLAGCRRVVVHGFSNGGSMAAALVCAGDRLDGRLLGVVVDDPVTDAATVGCEAPEIPVAVYWTGALDDAAPPGTRCVDLDWTCAGGTVRGVSAFAADLGVSPTASPVDEHDWYTASPLPLMWLE